MQQLKHISGNIVDLIAKKIFPGTIHIANGRITKITNNQQQITNNNFILPGFIDAHIHIESSMLPPAEFARLAVVHGTVATVSDPHEIANVLGTAGVEYMIADGKRAPFTFLWGAPSCVPATSFETAGANIDPMGVKGLLNNRAIKYLSEMMNFPGVIHHDPAVMEKIAIAKKLKKPIDGHAPGLRGKDLRTYIAAGISTDHESFQLDEALEKLSLGMKIIIREGSAAKNFEALHPILRDHWEMCMFCSDDKHPNDLVHGHINQVVARAVSLGYDTMRVLSCACLHPIQHYGLDAGCLRVGDRADFIEVRDLKGFKVLRTVIAGEVVAENGKSNLPRLSSKIVNNFHAQKKVPGEFDVYRHPERNEVKSKYPDRYQNSYGILRPRNGLRMTGVRIIEALDGQLITNEIHDAVDPKKDILKIAVVRRYPIKKGLTFPTKGQTFSDIAVGFIKGFGLKQGAIASTVAHDSHNIVAVGVTDQDICKAVNLLIETKGGIAAVGGAIEEVLPLPIAGFMSDQEGIDVARSYTKLDALAKELGSHLTAPFMTLSFMALPVIPHLKMTDKGLFDVDKLQHVSLYCHSEEPQRRRIP